MARCLLFFKPRKAPGEPTSAAAAAEELGVQEKWLVARRDITLGCKLGSGTFGAVYACKLEGSEETLVCAP